MVADVDSLYSIRLYFDPAPANTSRYLTPIRGNTTPLDSLHDPLWIHLDTSVWTSTNPAHTHRLTLSLRSLAMSDILDNLDNLLNGDDNRDQAKPSNMAQNGNQLPKEGPIAPSASAGTTTQQQQQQQSTQQPTTTQQQQQQPSPGEHLSSSPLPLYAVPKSRDVDAFARPTLILHYYNVSGPASLLILRRRTLFIVRRAAIFFVDCTTYVERCTPFDTLIEHYDSTVHSDSRRCR